MYLRPRVVFRLYCEPKWLGCPRGCAGAAPWPEWECQGGEGVEPVIAGRQMQWTARSGGDGGGRATPPRD